MKPVYLLLFLSLVFSINSNAQILNKLKQKAESAVNKTSSSKSQSTTQDNTSSSTITSSNTATMNYDFKKIPDAKIYFSDQPFTTGNSGAKNDFTMSDYIYARLELGNQTVQQAFNITDKKKSGLSTDDVNIYRLGLQMNAYVPGEEDPVGGWASSNYEAYFVVTESSLKNNYVNFDVKPDPARASTIMTDDLDAGPLYKISNETHFPQKGLYEIRLSVFLHEVDDWGNKINSQQEWPGAPGSFQLSFDPGGMAGFDKKREELKSWTVSALKNITNPVHTVSESKFYFSDKPFTNSNAGAKTNFTSQDFIYGRLELGGKTVSEAFKLDAQPTKGFHYLNYGVLITPKGKKGDIRNVIYNGSRPILVKTEDEKNTWFNFDVLAEPSKISTLGGATELPEKVSELKFAAGMDLCTNDINIQQHFPANGEYTVQLVLWNYSFDDWGKPLESEKNIISQGEFNYQFSAKDAATLIANSKKRYEALEMAEKMRTKLYKLPDWWSKPFTPGDIMLSPARLTPMIKSYISQWGLTYISHKIYPYSGPLGWTIYKDSQTGFPVSRRSNAEVYLLYKDKDGTCHIASVTIDESYAGGGTYGSPYLKGLWNDEFIECSAIK